MNNAYLYFIFIFSLLSFSCASDNSSSTGPPSAPIDSTSFKYPLTNGNSWSYTRTRSVSNIRPDSIRHLFSGYPYNGSGTITVAYDTTVNSVTVKCVSEVYSENNSETGGRSYYLNTDSAMYIYAYMGQFFFLPLEKQNEIYLKLDSKLIRLEDLSSFLSYEKGFANADSRDSLIMEIPPKQTLLYPEQSGRKWLFRRLWTDSLMKQYINFENLLVNNSNVSCVKVHMWWSQFTNLNMYVYHSKFGQMKFELAAKDEIVSDEFGHELGLIDYDELSTVTSYNVVIP